MTASGPVLGRFSNLTASEPTRLAVCSDLHLSVDAQGTWRVSHRTQERLEAAVASLNRQSLDGVVFNGDLVQYGTRAEYEAFDRIIDALEVPFVAIPGNHDLTQFGPGPKRTLSEFERRYTPGELPYRTRIGGIDLLALNSNQSTHDSIAETYVGRLDDRTLEWLSTQLASADHPLVAVHHNLPGTRAMLTAATADFDVEDGSPRFENADELVAVLENAPGSPPLVVTGHVHFPAVERTGAVREFTLPALGPYPGAYTVFEVTETGATATLHSVLDHDARIEALASGLENCRVLLAASQLAGVPLVEDVAAVPTAWMT